MNKRWNYIFLNGIRFKHDMKNPVHDVFVGKYGHIEDAYATPSITKKANIQ